MSAVAFRTEPAEAIVTAAVGSAAGLDELLGRVVELARCEAPFGVVVVVRDFALAPRQAGFAAIRRLPGGRAHLGTWCRGVVYVFESAEAEQAARQHLHEAPLLWGTRILVADATAEAVAWLHDELQR